MKNRSKIKNQKSKLLKKVKGQVAIVVLLVSAVVMTLGLSVSRKTVVETRIDSDEELLKQAFNTAESGIDFYLGTGGTAFSNPDGSGRAEISRSQIGNGTTLVSADLVTETNSDYFWLVGHNADGSVNIGDTYAGGNLDVCLDGNFSGAVLVEYFYKSGSSYIVERTAAASGVAVKDFSSVSGNCSIGGVRVPITTSGVPLLLRVIMIDGDSKITLSGSANFPIQGEIINSVGRAGNLQYGGVNTKIQIIRKYNVPSFMFQAVGAKDSVLSK